MVRSARVVTVLAVGLIPLVIGCDLLKKLKKDGADASADEAGAQTSDAVIDATTPSVDPSVPELGAAPKGSNENDIARFPDEKPGTLAVATVQVADAHARTVPPNGDLVANLKKGSSVTQISERGNYVLGVFDNPKNSNDTLMGWFSKASFSPVAVRSDAGTVTDINCPAGQSLLVVDLQTFCGKVCTVDTNCVAGKETCRGNGVRIVKGKAPEQVKTCLAIATATRDAGAPPVVVVADAGVPVVVKDAGTPVIPVLDAGRPIIPAGIEEYPSLGQPCLPGYLILAKDGFCHKVCTGTCRALKCTTRCGTPQSICVKPSLCP